MSIIAAVLNRNILILFFSQALGYSSISFLILVTGILAAQIGPSSKLTTLPLALVVIGTACSTIPAAMLMRRFGRRHGFLISYTISISGALLGFAAAWYQNFYALCACAFLNGCFLAFASHARFVVVECLEDRSKAGQAISFFLLGGIIAAFLGPEIAALGKNWFVKPFAGSFLLMVATFVASALVFLMFRNPQVRAHHDDLQPARTLSVIVRQPAFMIALSSSVISYAVMSFVMTATPISMNQIDNFNFEQAKQVIQWHIAAMFLPSLFNIFLFRFFGIGKLMLIGSLLYIGMALSALQGHGFHHYSSALIMLGIGWNFLFIAGTTLLPQCYRHSERFKTQATNDFVIFSTQGLASLAAGWMLYSIGWDNIIRLTLPLSVLMLMVAIYYSSQRHNLSADAKSPATAVESIEN